MKTPLFILLLLAGFTVGFIVYPWLDRPAELNCPEIPECPETFGISTSPIKVQDIKRFKGDLTSYTQANGPVFILQGNLAFPMDQATRSVRVFQPQDSTFIRLDSFLMEFGMAGM